jgi:hypothetical protein
MKKYIIKFIDGEIKEIQALGLAIDDFGNRVLIGEKLSNIFVVTAGTFKYIEEVMENSNVNSAPKAE